MIQLLRPIRKVLPATLMVVSLLVSKVLACPFCPTTGVTLSEKMQTSDAIVEIEWVRGIPGNKQSAGSTTYKITRILKSPAGVLKEGQEIELPAYRESKPGTKFLLTGLQVTTIEWDSPLSVSPEAFEYIVHSPAPGKSYVERLEYFGKYLEHEDELISGDAFGEFANAPFEEIAKLKETYSREKVKSWITSEKTNPTRLGLYGLMMGLCGTSEDEEFLLGKITEDTKEFRLGIEGVMSGYLMLTGERGLDQLVELKLKQEGVKFNEVFAVMQTMRFMWTYVPDRIPPEKLRAAMRILLDRVDMADLVISDLSRWQDWSVTDRVIEMYYEEEFAIPSIKRAAIRYLLICEASEKSEGDAEPSAHVKHAREALARIEKEDTALYQQTRRFFRVP